MPGQIAHFLGAYVLCQHQYVPLVVREETQLGAEEGSIVVLLGGRLDAESIGQIWKNAFQVLHEKNPKHLVIDASKVDYCDGAGIGLIFELLEALGFSLCRTAAVAGPRRKST